MSVKLLTEHNLEFLSLKGGSTGSSESTHVKMPHCWKSHITVNYFQYESEEQEQNMTDMKLKNEKERIDLGNDIYIL